MEQLKINLIPDGNMPIAHCSQNDSGRVVRLNLFDNDAEHTLSGTEVIKVIVRKPDSVVVEDSVVNTSSNYVDWTISDNACDVFGFALCELSVSGIGSRNFLLKIEEDAYDGAEIEVRTASGAIANFETNLADELKSVICSINPTQSGSGTPSPTNPRSISGYTACNVVVADEDMQTKSTTNIPFGQTVYGGSLDVTSGILTIDKGYIDLGTLTWSYSAPTETRPIARFNASIPLAEDTGVSINIMSDIYNPSSSPVAGREIDSTICLLSKTIYICDSRFSDANSFKTAVTGHCAVYPLATPTEVQLTPKQIAQIVGTNNVYHDCNGDTTVEYYIEV